MEVLQLMADYIRKMDCRLNGGLVEGIKAIRLSDDLTRRLAQAEEDDSVHVGRKEKQRRALDRRRKRDAALAEGRDVDYHLGTASQVSPPPFSLQSLPLSLVAPPPPAFRADRRLACRSVARWD